MSDSTQQAGQADQTGQVDPDRVDPSQETAVEVDPVEAIKTTALAPINAIESGINALVNKYGGVVFDLTSTKGMKEAKEARAEIRKPRYKVENVRKATASALESVKRTVNEQAESIKTRLLAIENPIDEQIKAEEKRAEEEADRLRKAEEARIATIRTQIENISSTPTRAVSKGVSSKDIQVMLDLWEKPLDSDVYQEFLAEANHVREKAREELLVILARVKRAEEDAVLASERERELAERDAQIAEKDRLLAEALATIARLQAPKVEEPKQPDPAPKVAVADVVAEPVCEAPAADAGDALAKSIGSALSSDDQPDFNESPVCDSKDSAESTEAVPTEAVSQQAESEPSAVADAQAPASEVSDGQPVLFAKEWPSIDRVVAAVATHFGVTDDEAKQYIIRAGETLAFEAL